MVFTGVRLLHRQRAFSKKRWSSQAFTFFTGSGPFPKRNIFTGVRLLHRLWAFSKTQHLHRCSPSSQALGLFQNATASQAFAFFTGSGPFPKCNSFTGVRLLHRLWAFSKHDSFTGSRPFQNVTASQALGLFRGKTSGGAGCSTRSGRVPPPESPSTRSRAC